MVDILSKNDTDYGLTPDDGDIQVTGSPTPDDGNIQVKGNSQTRDNDAAHVPAVLCDRHVLTDNQNDNGCSLPPDDGNIQVEGSLEPDDGNIQVTGDSQVTGNLTPDDGNIQVGGDSQSHDNDVALVHVVQCDRHVLNNTQNNTGCGLSPDDGDIQVTGNNGVTILHTIPKGVTKITELTLELFNNNYHLYAQKINHPEEGLLVRAILMKNNAIFFNHTYKIIGTSNVAIATIASTDQVCNHYLVHADKGDTFICALGDGHNGVRNSIIRNEHLFIISSLL